MYNSGYIPFYRDELEDWLVQDPQRFMWWIWIRCRAAYKPCMQCVGQARVEVNLRFGELAVTKTHLKNVWGVNIKTVDRFLKQMVKDGRISFRDEKGVLIIHVIRNELITVPSGMVGETDVVMENQMIVEPPYETTTETEDEMPDAFWITQSEDDVNASQDKTIENVVLSFDEQINALLSDEEKTKIKKLSA